MVGRVEAWLSFVESFIELKYFHDVETPAPILRFKAPSRIGGFGCDELVVYGIRELA